MKTLILSGVLLSVTVDLTTYAQAASPINSTQDGRIIQAGTYYNTSSGKTTFLNSHSGDLWLQSGSTVRGLEVNNTGKVTNNGGSIQLYAPDNVVRVDGNINVSGLVNGHGAYLGNGGRVEVNSAYLYQNGNIIGIGNLGGHVNIGVNSATFGPTAKIDVGSPNAIGGTIRIYANGVVDIQKGAGVNTSGVLFPKLPSNIIQIDGRVVNNEGLIRANGISTNAGQDINASKGGIIQMYINDGNLNLQPVATALSNSTVITPANKLATLNRLQDLANNYANSIRNTGSITANAGTVNPLLRSNGGDGGKIQLTSNGRILNQITGIIEANGGVGHLNGNGGVIELSSKDAFRSQNNGWIQAYGGFGPGLIKIGPEGSGGNGGIIAIQNLINSGTISANARKNEVIPSGTGGNGGIINAFNVTNGMGGTISATGNNGSVLSNGLAGNGGVITATNFTNQGSVVLSGGDSFKTSNNHAGNGGLFQGTNVVNVYASNIEARGGYATSPNGKGIAIGGNGGKIQITNLTNSGVIASNGGSGIYGGNGGLLSFNQVNNTGCLRANGGSTFNYQNGIKGTAGDGGTIIGTQVITSLGTVEALGGISGVSPKLNGKDGTVIGF